MAAQSPLDPVTIPPVTIPPGPSCPIAPDLTDEAAGRIAALLSLGLLALAMGSGRVLAPLALAADFAVRAAGRPSFSPTARTAGWLRRQAGLAERRINAGPKRFAATVGALFSLGIGAALLAGLRPLGLALATILGLCAGLEAFFGFCLACRVHPWLPWVRAGAARLEPVRTGEPAA
jgi:hypothetical protein